MIANQSQPRFNSFEGECHDDLATLVCRCDGSHVAELRLSFGNSAELDRFALAVQTLVEQYRVELANPPAPPVSEVDRLLVEAVVSSRPVCSCQWKDHPGRVMIAPDQHDVGCALRPQQWGECPVCTGDFGPVGNTEPCDLCRAEGATLPLTPDEPACAHCGGPDVGACSNLCGSCAQDLRDEANAEACDPANDPAPTSPVEAVWGPFEQYNQRRIETGSAPLTQAEYDALPF